MEKDRCERNRLMVLMQSFWQLEKAIMMQVKQTAANNDLSIPQFSILAIMHHRGKMAQKKLQARTHYPKSTLSHAIEGLVKAGLVKRTRMEGNRREMDLELSEYGRNFFEQIKNQERAVHAKFKKAVNSLSEDEFTEMIKMHQHIASYFEGSEEK